MFYFTVVADPKVTEVKKPLSPMTKKLLLDEKKGKPLKILRMMQPSFGQMSRRLTLH
jgi:hypothetical protein